MLKPKKLDEIQKRLLMEIADLHEVPEGAYNIRANGESAGRASSANIEIVPKDGDKGLDIYVKPGTKKESVHIPVVLTESGLKEVVYNDFHIGEDADVLIVAGCGIDNCGMQDSEHDGIHRFYVGKGAKVRYVEKHYGPGTGAGKRILNTARKSTWRRTAPRRWRWCRSRAWTTRTASPPRSLRPARSWSCGSAS